MNEPDADDKVNQILDGIDLDMDGVLRFVRRPVKQKSSHKTTCSGNQPLSSWLISFSPGQTRASTLSWLANCLAQLDKIERIDRLTTIAETRRNAMLREIDRRRTVLGETLRRQVQEVEGEFEVIEKTPTEAKSAA